MNKKEEEELKKRLENAEFNNIEEDLKNNEEEENKKTSKEVDESFSDLKNDKKKNIIIIALVSVVIILLIIVLIFLLSGKKDDNNNKENSNNENTSTENSENNNNNDIKKTVTEEKYNYSNARVYYNKYLVIKSKEDNNRAISDLEGNIITEISDSWAIYEGNEKSLYLVDLNYKKEGNFNIKRIKDNKVVDVFKENGTGLLLAKENDGLLGVYKQNKENETIYLINGNEYSTINLDNYVAKSSMSDERDSKHIYNSKYIITFDKMNNEKFEDYGIYDIKSNKQVLKGTYDNIIYLHDDVFAAVKNDKSGVIDVNNKTLLNFNYDVVTYSNGLYFVGNNNKVKLLDNNFKDMNQEIEVPNLSNYSYSICCENKNPFELIPYKENVILKVINNSNELSDYYAFNKNGLSFALAKGNIGFVDNYLIASNDQDTNIIMLDSGLNTVHTIDVGSKAISLDNVYIYLNNLLVINGSKLYSLDTNSSKGTTSWYRRTSQEFEVRIDFKGEKGTVTISRNGEEIKKIEDVSIYSFLKAENNGITVTKEYLIYNADGVAIVKRNEEDVIAQENR